MITKNSYILSLLFVFFSNEISSQVIGNVVNENLEVIPYVNVYLEGTTIGTSSNDLGHYELNLTKGPHTVVFQQIGYEKFRKLINYNGELIKLDVKLKDAIYALDALEFISSREDPAYTIIRKAIERKKMNEVPKFNYNCQAYTKGLLKVLSAPEKIFGQKVGTLAGSLDTTRRGILYLSEAESILQFSDNEVMKETMISSRVAGNDRGFSFNRASALNFNLYRNSFSLGRGIISPIADFALSHYKYRLIGSNKNQDGLIINKIQMIPRVKSDPVWTGYIYIEDSTYAVYEFDAFILGSQIKQNAFDSIFLTQNHFFNNNLNVWSLRNQLFRFNAGVFKFKFAGKFLVNFSNFEIEDKHKINNQQEVLEILNGSNKKSSIYWDSIRPVPLTLEESSNYIKKDSIKLYKESKSYQDSMDHISNKLQIGNLLLGYEWSNSNRRKYCGIESPINSIYFNPIQGLVVGLKTSYSKYLDIFEWTRKLSYSFNIEYGISDLTWRSSAGLNYKYDKIKSKNIGLRFGRELKEYNSTIKTNEVINQLYSLFLKNNVLKLYNQDFVELDYGGDINYSIRLISKLGFVTRTNIVNRSNYSIRLKGKSYESNSSNGYQDSILLVRHKSLIQFEGGIILTPFNRVWKSPDGIQKIGSSWPVINFLPVITYYDQIRRLLIHS
ncbi:MAG: DUF5686 and carboxypeptidase regulatory-like domain-containing protein, partial [Saprospiraceae bacterium]